jgi:hypothetical protein
MEKLYRLEFNEKQQHFHLNNYTHEENTNGWFTVCKHCSDFEFKLFSSFIYSKKENKLTKEIILKSFSELKYFIKNLNDFNLHICKETV